MAPTKNNKDSIVLDACVLAPMPLCDTLLRLAEHPAFFNPLWSEYLLQEVGQVLTKMGYSAMQRERRLNAMITAFPEAAVEIFDEFIESIDCPDPDDRHVLAAAIQGHANTIVTNNVRDFPEQCRAKYGILCQTPDEFLIQHFHLNPTLLLERLDQQSAAIRQSRSELIVKLQKLTPLFADLLRQ
ncbi:MAG TPA: PIN domain-containing protein [Candidatus Angelobacter sp.]|jgi:predicted nucleic acid-binding protein|nr:PIN domain-containing protein [Candidatus Angelobacter sp.]